MEKLYSDLLACFSRISTICSSCSALFSTIDVFLKVGSSDSLNQIHIGIFLEKQISYRPMNHFLALHLKN